MAVKGFIFWFFVLALGVAAVFYIQGRFGSAGDGNFADVTIGDRTFMVEVADTPKKRAKGLSGREYLSEDSGMIFLFSRKGIQRFWMKDTLIPLDIVWLRGNEVVGFSENVEPEPGIPPTSLKVYNSPPGVDRVLEFIAGTVHDLGLEAGDTVDVRFQ